MSMMISVNTLNTSNKYNYQPNFTVATKDKTITVLPNSGNPYKIKFQPAIAIPLALGAGGCTAFAYKGSYLAKSLLGGMSALAVLGLCYLRTKFNTRYTVLEIKLNKNT